MCNSNGNTHHAFKEFIGKCVKTDGSLLTNDNELFTKPNLEKARDFLKAFKPIFVKLRKDAKEANEKNKKYKSSKNEKVKVWTVRDIFNGLVFDDELFKTKLESYKNHKEAIIKILLHCNWLMYLCSEQQHKQKTIDGYYKKEGIDDYFKVDTEWSIGSTLSGIPLDAMLFIVELVLNCKDQAKAEIDVLQQIEKNCNDNNWRNVLKWQDGKTISSDAMVNIILFLCDTEHYLPIPAQNKKQLICDKLEGIISEEKINDSLLPDDMSETDKKLYAIRHKIIEIKDDQNNEKYGKIVNPFWLPEIRPFWDELTEDLDKESLSIETLLEYKKAMVLYGPPGTSKSYQARSIAKSMIAKALRASNNSISDCIHELKSQIHSHIHILQMHPNYTYDDFIVGKTIKQNGIAVYPGELLRIIAEITDELPHFIILDEINRVDISRVFGELFTAMESSYRDNGLELSVNVNDIPAAEKTRLDKLIVDNKLYLKVPNEMYFIGTMNMIDFSLEQVDFALRRRFLWKLSTYDKNRLEEIIGEKIANGIKDLKNKEKDAKSNAEKEELQKELDKWRNMPDDFIECCTALNDEIRWETSLGENYLIGHTFFAEIVDIFQQVKDWDKAKNLLWQVSLLPTLKAYCGTMDSETQDGFIERCTEAFRPLEA